MFVDQTTSLKWPTRSHKLLQSSMIHDDVMKWKRFPHYWWLCHVCSNKHSNAQWSEIPWRSCDITVIPRIPAAQQSARPLLCWEWRGGLLRVSALLLLSSPFCSRVRLLRRTFGIYGDTPSLEHMRWLCFLYGRKHCISEYSKLFIMILELMF